MAASGVSADRMVLISVADHVVEPPTLFATHFPAGRGVDPPRLADRADGTVGWLFQGRDLGSPGGGRRLRPATDPGAPPGYEGLDPAYYDPAARLAALDRNGVVASLSYPTFGGFTGDRLFGVPGADLVVSAYNDWQVTGWAAAQPGRCVPLGVLPVWDVDAAVAEARRLAALGVTAVTFPESPYSVDLPSFSTDHWDPLLREICAADLALCLQMTPPAPAGSAAPVNPFFDRGDLLAPQAAATACTDLIVSGVFTRFPDLRIAMSEGGIGWIPFLLDRIDLHLQNQVWSGLDLGGLTGTEVFQKHFLASFVTDPSSLYLRRRIGIDAIAWASDFPLADSTWPDSAREVAAELTAAGATEEEAAMITWRNAARFFRFDPVPAR